MDGVHAVARHEHTDTLRGEIGRVHLTIGEVVIAISTHPSRGGRAVWLLFDDPPDERLRRAPRMTPRSLHPTSPSRSGTRKTFPMSALSSRCPITGVRMNEGKWPVCPLCEALVKPTEPVGPPMADRRIVHLRCWIRKRQGVTDGTGSGE